MIRPLSFRRNEETGDNTFQSGGSEEPSKLLNNALDEFDGFVEKLRSKGIDVVVRDSVLNDDTPDALFPNNWISFHHDGRVAIYPMKAPNRRRERREDLIFEVSNELGLHVEEILDFTEFEDHDSFLEGTGSMVLDRINHICYAALSERTDQQAVEIFCETFGYKPVCFSTSVPSNDGMKSVYHANVVMCLGTQFAVLCADVIATSSERQLVIDSLERSGKNVIEISIDQLNQFAGNMLEVLNSEGKTYIAMSRTAENALSIAQRTQLKKYGEILSAPLETIENHGGGSARCMLCEVFLPKL